MTISVRPDRAYCYKPSMSPDIRRLGCRIGFHRLPAPATHARAALAQPLDGDFTVDHARAISHDLEAHALHGVTRFVGRAVGQADAVVRDREPHVALFDHELNVDLGRIAVAHGIGNRLLRDAVEVVRRRLIDGKHGPHTAAQAHVDAVHFARPRREAAQLKYESAAVQAHGREAARERASAFDRVVHEHDDLVDVGGEARIALADPAREATQHERDAGQFLAEPVVQVAADALLFAVRDLDDLVLQLLALGNVPP